MHNTKILVMHGIKNFIPVETAAECRQMPTKVIFLCQKELNQPKKKKTISEQHIISWVFVDGPWASANLTGWVLLCNILFI